MNIPVQNIYYLLSYAWNKLEESQIVSVDKLDSTKLTDLFAKVLSNGMAYILKRGLDRSYVLHEEITRTLRGKVDFNTTLKRNYFFMPDLNCHYDDLNHNVLHNQIIKSTILNLLSLKDLDKDIREELVNIVHKLHEIDRIKLTSRHFGLVQLHSNNSFYDLLLRICELIHDALMISEEQGSSKFRDFTRDERAMRILFEEFVRNFYKREQSEYKIYRENISWDTGEMDEHSNKLLPRMQTDISLSSNDRKIIIDTKYYTNALQMHYDKESIRSSNLYQIYAYLTNVKPEYSGQPKSEGILLYPTVTKELDSETYIKGHKISFKTINLNQDWQGIHQDLLNVLN